MEYTREELAESKKQIDSVLHKTRQVVLTLREKEDPGRYKSQITLAQRRIRAFEISSALLQRELEGTGEGAHDE